jgi:hypothetical protein
VAVTGRLVAAGFAPSAAKSIVSAQDGNSNDCFISQNFYLGFPVLTKRDFPARFLFQPRRSRPFASST